MELRQEQQLNPVEDEVLALTAVVRPILTGVLYGLKREVVAEVGGYENVKLMMLPRLIRPGDGDIGVCFEYAVHNAMNTGDARVIERVNDALRLCNVPRGEPKSILFGVEKTGSVQLIDTAREILTDESRALTGNVGQPPKLRKHLNAIAGAFRNRRTRPSLPYSIQGLWKADLFLGSSEPDRWVGTTVKINPTQLEGAAGLRVGIVPIRQGRTDRVHMDHGKNLVICPLHHDADFMQIFYEGWRVVQAFIAADANVPRDVMLPRPMDREVCRILTERRQFNVVEVIEAIQPYSQPELLTTTPGRVGQSSIRGNVATQMVVAPISRSLP